jgi:hypothetical protein
MGAVFETLFFTIPDYGQSTQNLCSRVQIQLIYDECYWTTTYQPLKFYFYRLNANL